MVVDEIEFNQTGLDFYTTRFMIKLQIQLIISEIKKYIYLKFPQNSKAVTTMYNLKWYIIHGMGIYGTVEPEDSREQDA